MFAQPTIRPETVPRGTGAPGVNNGMELDISNNSDKAAVVNTNNNEDNVASDYDDHISQQDKFLAKESTTGCQSDLEPEEETDEETDMSTKSEFHLSRQLATDETTTKNHHNFANVIISLARKIVSQKVGN